MAASHRSRTRELPGNYPFSVKDSLIRQVTESWKELAKNCFQEVEQILRSHIGRLVWDHFNKYEHSGLLEEIG